MAASTAGGSAEPDGQPNGRRLFWASALGSVGVVFGDIGTSPLYAFKESVAALGRDGEVANRTEVFGVISLMLWSLLIVVFLKYVVLLMRLDNRGEGGTLSLMALLQRALGKRPLALLVMGICGAGLFYGDALLTPAISVLSAVEGLTVIPAFEGWIDPLIVPLALIILTGLFLVQRRGTGVVGAWFGPICLVWFLTLGGLGVYRLIGEPTILAAISPHHAIQFMTSHSVLAFVVLGSVFLTVTGAEALYADMGHFGRKPVTAAWTALVLPSLALNYLGQGALVLRHPETIENPFFMMAPQVLQGPLVLLATMATVIASQAVITGAFSLTRQAIQLGLLPRLNIVNTSEQHQGQIYIPQVNYLLLAGVVALVLGFRTSSGLAAAYGISVSGEMIISTLLAFIAIQRVWGRKLWQAGLIVLPFLLVELVFLASNLLKLFQGGYLTLLIAGAIAITMWTWVRGSRLLSERSSKGVPLEAVMDSLRVSPPHTVSGTAVFLTQDPAAAPAAFLHNLKHNKVLHETIVVLTVRADEQPRVADEDKIEITEVRPGVKRMTISYGFMETPNISRSLSIARKRGLWSHDIMSTSFFLSRRSLLPDSKTGMPIWQDHLFIFLARNASHASEFFRVPTSRVVELGTQMLI
ncbi:potassium transporter Kup [bacterium]|nr:potassium transporter Kup [bacterium]